MMINFKLLLFLVIVAISTAEGSYYEDDDDEDTDFRCSEPGRFLDTRDKTCSSYFLCTSKSDGYSQDSYTCPGKAIFDSTIGHCKLGGQCVIESKSHTDKYENGEFVCDGPGAFDNTKDPNCESYYVCKRDHNGKYTVPIKYYCSYGSKFDPHNEYCSSHYTCPRTFECSSVGRFEDALDNYMKKYFLCVQDKKGFFKQSYSCPVCSRFDDELELCRYIEKCDPDEDKYHDYSLPMENWDHVDGARCTARGYFKFNNSKQTSYYQFCDVSSDGSLTTHTMHCPPGDIWNDDIKLCEKCKV